MEKAQPSASESDGQRASGVGSPQVWKLVVALGVATALMLAIGVVLVATSGHPERLLGIEQQSDESGPSFGSGKLAGSQETLDENGIVHGTTPAGVRYEIHGRNIPARGSSGIGFAALGDVLATDMNFGILDAYGGKVGDGIYDFGPYYQEIAPVLAAYDLCFANQETPMAGVQDDFEYSGYPTFNTPESSAQAMADAGINIVNFNSNHTWDMGEKGMENSHAVFAQYPQMMVVGSYASQRDRDTVHLEQRGDMTIAFLSYCYGTNMYGESASTQPNNYYNCIFDKNTMTAEVKRAQSVADAVVVYMHWGTEEMAEPDKTQLEYAQFLANLDVDLVIGSHAHLCQTVRYYTSPSGKQVPVVFGLSDLISGWTITSTIFSGMVTCDFVWKGGSVAVENLLWHPLVEWSDGGNVYVRLLERMDDATIQKNTRTEDVADDVAYFKETLDSLAMECPVAWPSVN